MARLVLSSLHDCEKCGMTFEHDFTFPEYVQDREDIDEAPVERVMCPNPECNHSQEIEWGGWTAHDEA